VDQRSGGQPRSMILPVIKQWREDNGFLSSAGSSSWSRYTAQSENHPYTGPFSEQIDVNHI